MTPGGPVPVGTAAGETAATTVVIADDHPTFRRGLRSVLEAAGFLVLGEAADGRAAVERVLELRPDVVLLDLHMPELNGDEVTRRLVRDLPGVKICVLTMFHDDESVFACLRAGARGYLLKEAEHTAIERAVAAVAAGEAIYAPSVAGRLHSYFAAAEPVAAAPFPTLAPREREVLSLMAQGLDNAGIAAELGLGAKTIRNLVSNIFAKLGTADRVQTILLAREAGLGTR